MSFIFLLLWIVLSRDILIYWYALLLSSPPSVLFCFPLTAIKIVQFTSTVLCLLL